ASEAQRTLGYHALALAPPAIESRRRECLLTVARVLHAHGIDETLVPESVQQYKEEELDRVIRERVADIDPQLKVREQSWRKWSRIFFAAVVASVIATIMRSAFLQPETASVAPFAVGIVLSLIGFCTSLNRHWHY